MRAILNLPPSVRLIEAALEGLVQVNRVLIETGVVPPSPLDAGVRYKRERSGLEEWDNALTCIKRGWGDCEDLNGWECARINIDEDPEAICQLLQTGRKMFHCIILMSDGTLRDICPDLGMKVPGTALEGVPWVETRAENIIGGSRSARRQVARATGIRLPGGSGTSYVPRPSSQTQSSTSRPYRPASSRSGQGEPYQPRPRSPRDPMAEPETMAPGTESATQMVSPTSTANPGMDLMPMPMMEPEEAQDDGLDEGEEFDAEMEEGEGDE